MKTESKKLENGDLQVTITFDSHDQICLEHDLLNIVDWYAKGPSQEKINSCRNRMIKENKDKILKDPEMLTKSLAEVNAILDDPELCVDYIRKNPEYKNRMQRDEDARLEAEARLKAIEDARLAAEALKKELEATKI